MTDLRLSTVSTAFYALEQAGVRWCVLRGEAELSAPAGDIDVLIARTDARRVECVLNAAGFVRLPGWGRGSHTFYFSYDRSTGRWIKLDIVTELAFGPHYTLRTREAAGCLARRCYVGGVGLLAPDDAFWALLLHCLLDKEHIASHHAERLQELAEAARLDGPLAQVADRACPRGWGAGRLVACVQSGEWTALAQLAPAMRAAWTRRQPIIAWQRALMSRLLQRLDRWHLRWPYHGLSVALLGPDGAGKSSLVVGIRETFCFPTRSIYMGRGQERTTRTIRSRIPGADLVTQLLTIWRRYLIGRYYQMRGFLVIFDRYTYDALLEPRKHLTWRDQLYFWLLGHACPAPDLILLLDAPGSVMYERKGEHSPEVLERWRQGFLALRPQLPQLEVVDASRATDAVQAEAMGRIWQHYLAHESKQRR